MQVMQPLRVTHSYTQHLPYSAEAVFPLLCPVRERDWIETWNPSVVITGSGVAELHCTFTTESGDNAATWTVTRYEPPTAIEFVKFGPGPAITHISIVVRAVGSSRCEADITYAITALPGGEHVVEAFGEENFRSFMETWQRRLEHYLGTGEMLRAASSTQV
jgi:hypothetical protein